MITDKKRYYSLRIFTKTDKSNMAAQNKIVINNFV